MHFSSLTGFQFPTGLCERSKKHIFFIRKAFVYEIIIACRARILFMDWVIFAQFGMKILEGMFFVGLAGSSVVVLISFVEDAKELFGSD